MTSWEVLKPSKKWRKGTRLSRVAEWATSAMSCASCALLEHSIAKPVWRQAITSVWSPKIESPWPAMARAETCITKLMSSPAILYMLGTISRRPWDAVKVVISVPVCNAPCTEPATPPSLCSWLMDGVVPQMFFLPFTAHSSQFSAMGEEGVMGYIAIVSLTRKAIEATASFPSVITLFLLFI